MSGWIDVKDRLPEMTYRGARSENVLIRRDCGKGSVPSTSISFRWSEAQIMSTSFNDEHSITDCWDGQESKGYRVTHWMPLPEPPKGQ